MKLEHLMQAYKHNNVDVEMKEISNERERIGVLTFEDGIAASYLLDEEDIIVSIVMFFNCLARGSMKIDAQLSHVIKVLNVLQNTIMLLTNISQKECNMILERLGLFDNTFVKRKTN